MNEHYYHILSAGLPTLCWLVREVLGRIVRKKAGIKFWSTLKEAMKGQPQEQIVEALKQISQRLETLEQKGNS